MVICIRGSWAVEPKLISLSSPEERVGGRWVLLDNAEKCIGRFAQRNSGRGAGMNRNFSNPIKAVYLRRARGESELANSAKIHELAIHGSNLDLR